MKIVVIGPGALGTLFAAFLSRERGNDVWLLDRRRARAGILNSRRLTVSGITKLSIPRGRVRATHDARRPGPCDLVLLLVKSFDTEQALRRASSCIGATTLVLTLQNGLDNLARARYALRRKPTGGVLAGITAQGATLLGPGRVNHAGREDTFIGADSAVEARQARRVADVLRRAGIRTRMMRGTARLIWSKLVINSAMNPLGAVLRVRNGDLIQDRSARLLLRATTEESAAVARAAGIRLIYHDPVKKIEEVCRATAANFNSMLQDFKRGRRTEVGHINGAIVRQARRLGVPAPINAAFLKALDRRT